jgi:hypothetical protein
MRNIFLILLTIFVFSQCAEECETCGQGKIMKNYILKYYTLFDYSNIYIDTPEEDSAGIIFKAYFYNGKLINSLFPENEKMLADFHEIAKNNGDTAYYRPISTCFPYTCLTSKAGRFDIYCDTIYAGYSAGTSLNEFVTICFYSAEDFIRNGYVSSDINTPIKQYCMPLTEFNVGNHYLMASNHISFILSIKPDRPALSFYRFVFTYSDNSFEFSDYAFMR